MKDGKLLTAHCTNSASKTFHGDQWVTAEAEVHGGRLIRHIINGDVVFEYNQPQLDEMDPDAKRLLDAGAEKMLTSGTISLQSEKAHRAIFERWSYWRSRSNARICVLGAECRRPVSRASWRWPLVARMPRFLASVRPHVKSSDWPSRSVIRPPASVITIAPAAWSQIFSR